MKRLITSVLVLTCLVVAPLSAQTDQTGVLQGTVQDEAGSAIAVAEVRISLADGSYLQATLSDASGRFRLGFLKPGAYVLTMRAIGFRPVDLTNVRIRAEWLRNYMAANAGHEFDFDNQLHWHWRPLREHPGFGTIAGSGR